MSSSPCMCLCWAQSYSTLCNPWTVACQVPLSMGFFRQKYWSGLPLPPPRNLPDLGIKPTSPTLQLGSLPLSHQGIPCMCLRKFSCNSSEKYSVTHTFSLRSCPLLSQALCYTNKCMYVYTCTYTHRVRETVHWQKRQKERLGIKKCFAAVTKHGHF